MSSELNNGYEFYVTFDTENSIITGTYLDILLNTEVDKAGEEEKANKNDNKEKNKKNEEDAIKKLVINPIYKYVTEIDISQYELKELSKLKKLEHILYCKSKEKVDMLEEETSDKDEEGKKEEISAGNEADDKGKNPNKETGSKYKPGYPFSGGIVLRNEQSNKLGTGNIVINGEPGVGKSTLAFQIAAACASDLNNGIAIYYSLDMDSNQLKNAMISNDAKEKTKVTTPIITEINCTGEEEFDIKDVLKKNESQEVIPQILMPELSPRGISPTGDIDYLFQQRFEELEITVKAARKYNNEIKGNEPKIKLIVIDSLNTFGEKKIKHEQIHRIFELFRKNYITGIFTLGMFEGSYVNDDTIDTAAALFLSDVLINLTKEQFENYSFNMMEIRKSRHINHVRGKQVYKINNISEIKTEDEDKDKDKGLVYMLEQNPFHSLGLKKELHVWPSLHHYIISTEDFVKKTNAGKQTKSKEKNLFGIEAFNDVLPEHFMWNKNNPQNNKMSQIVSLVGDSGLYKSDIAIGSLLSGILAAKENREVCNSLIIRMSDKDNLRTRGVRLSEDLLNKYKILYESSKTDTNKTADSILDEWGNIFKELKNSKDTFETNKYEETLNKMEKSLYEYSLELKNENNLKLYEIPDEKLISSRKTYKSLLSGWTLDKDHETSHLLEIIFKSGALCPEEFVYKICQIIHVYNIKRIAIMDLKLLNESYPFLVNSPTSGTMFLSALIHIFRNYGIDVVFSASSNKKKEHDPLSSQIEKLSDASITFSMNESKVEVDGEGLVTKGGNLVKKHVVLVEEANKNAQDNTNKLSSHSITFISEKEAKEETKVNNKNKPDVLGDIKTFKIE